MLQVNLLLTFAIHVYIGVTFILFHLSVSCHFYQFMSHKWTISAISCMACFSSSPPNRERERKHLNKERLHFASSSKTRKVEKDVQSFESRQDFFVPVKSEHESHSTRVNGNEHCESQEGKEKDAGGMNTHSRAQEMRVINFKLDNSSKLMYLCTGEAYS